MAADPSAVRQTVLDAMNRIAAERQVALGPVDDAAPLTGTGLDSLGFAVLVARLEEELGVDPFSSADEIALPLTVGDLVRFYHDALR